MKKNIIISAIGILILSSSFSVFAEWKVGDEYFMVNLNRSTCSANIEHWRIIGVNNGVAEVIFNNKTSFTTIKKLNKKFLTIKSANKSKVSAEKRCKGQAQLRKQYEG